MSSLEYMRAWRAKNREKLAADARARYHANPEPKRAYARARRRRVGRSEKARWLVHLMVEFGLMQCFPCEKCGAAKTEGHHTDYTKPLNVRWLCRSCHGREHRSKA